MRKEGEGNEAISDGSGRILEARALLQRSYHLGEESEDIRDRWRTATKGGRHFLKRSHKLLN